jgi:hypothetical protein
VRSGRSIAAGLAAALALAASLVAPQPAAASRGPYADGEKVRLTGIVTDPAGHPISELQVVLEASRAYFNLRHFQQAKKDVTRLTGITNERGEYTLEWPWNGYYNSFELQIGIPTRRPDGEHLKVLERLDLTRRIEQGSPVVSAVVVSDAAFVKNLRDFLATIKTDDERQVHQQMGEPDKVERNEYPDHLEVSWWYFESGKVYRFRDGKLMQIDPFDPVKGF